MENKENYFAHSSSIVDKGCSIGKRTKIWHFSHIMSGCTIGKACNIGQSAGKWRGQYAKTYVGKGATIGANATIVCGNDIGQFSLIGAGTVVTKLVKPYALIVGNPGRQIGWISEFGHRLIFDDEQLATCSESKQLYKMVGDKIERV